MTESFEYVHYYSLTIQTFAAFKFYNSNINFLTSLFYPLLKAGLTVEQIAEQLDIYIEAVRQAAQQA